MGLNEDGHAKHAVEFDTSGIGMLGISLKPHEWFANIDAVRVWVDIRQQLSVRTNARQKSGTFNDLDNISTKQPDVIFLTIRLQAFVLCVDTAVLKSSRQYW